MMRRMAWRVWVMSDSVLVPRIGKKRIKWSGGGSTVMSLMRSSSVWLVRSGALGRTSKLCTAFAFIVLSFVGINLKKGMKK